ncbi:MAG: glycine--tRNA ligase subunit beta, partial [Gammaproteobacteria bacterium RIFOXYB2_FULL_38_6]
VTALVEWPIAHAGQFNPRFLKTPKEALISSMKKHQKCFPVMNNKGELQPCFIMISNIESKHPESVIRGNEKVINARLSDAAFFFEQDLKQTFEMRLEKLKQVTFQEKLGSLYDRAKRLEKLAGILAKKLKCKTEEEREIKRTALFCKGDLVSELVYEFPELQGIAGYHYALAEKNLHLSANAIRDHYKPAFSGDTLPNTLASQIIALADKIDLLIGIIGINQLPTGDKDPFALRRAALGVVRILTEKNMSLDLMEILNQSANLYLPLPNHKVTEQTFDFILQRLKAFYLDQTMPTQIFNAVEAVKPLDLLDFVSRMKAVVEFTKLPEAENLSAANKRVLNILKKEKIVKDRVEVKLFESDAEKHLWQLIQKHQKSIAKLCKS